MAFSIWLQIEPSDIPSEDPTHRDCDGNSPCRSTNIARFLTYDQARAFYELIHAALQHHPTGIDIEPLDSGTHA